MGNRCINSPVNRMPAFRSILLGGMVGISSLVLWTGCSEQNSSTTPAAGSEATAKAYTLDTCVVSDEKLGSMGDPVLKVYAGQQVKFCCNSCVKDFEKDQAKFLAKIATATAAKK